MNDISFDLEYKDLTRKDGVLELSEHIKIVSIVDIFVKLLYDALRNTKSDTNVKRVSVCKITRNKFTLDINNSTVVYPAPEDEFYMKLYGINRLLTFIVGV